MKIKKPSVVLAIAIILLIIVLHNKLHSEKKVIVDEQNIEVQTKSEMETERPLFPSTIYRLVEIAL